MKVSVCLLLDGGYWGTRYCFQKTGFTTMEKKWVVEEERGQTANYINNIEVELLVANINGCDLRFKEYFEPISNHYLQLNGKSEAVAYNSLFRLATGDYICVIKPNLILPNDWLTELCYYYGIISKRGIVCIAEKIEGKTFTQLLDRDLDEFIGAFTCPNDKIEGTFMFDKEYLNYIGAFQEDPPLYGQELNHYGLRSTSLGLTNFYLPDTFGVKAERSKEYGQELKLKGLENYDLSVEEMANRKNWYIKL